MTMTEARLFDELADDLRKTRRERGRPIPPAQVNRIIEEMGLCVQADETLRRLRHEHGVSEPDVLAGLRFYGVTR